MQIIIDVPNSLYNHITTNIEPNRQADDMLNVLISSIVDGTPLPKGHGRIGDLDQILMWLIYKKGIIDKLKCGEIAPVFKDATIIGADEEEIDFCYYDNRYDAEVNKLKNRNNVDDDFTVKFRH